MDFIRELLENSKAGLFRERKLRKRTPAFFRKQAGHVPGEQYDRSEKPAILKRQAD